MGSSGYGFIAAAEAGVVRSPVRDSLEAADSNVISGLAETTIAVVSCDIVLRAGFVFSIAFSQTRLELS